MFSTPISGKFQQIVMTNIVLFFFCFYIADKPSFPVCKIKNKVLPKSKLHQHFNLKTTFKIFFLILVF